MDELTATHDDSNDTWLGLLIVLASATAHLAGWAWLLQMFADMP